VRLLVNGVFTKQKIYSARHFPLNKITFSPIREDKSQKQSGFTSSKSMLALQG
jgi:hypothetical protein